MCWVLTEPHPPQKKKRAKTHFFCTYRYISSKHYYVLRGASCHTSNFQISRLAVKFHCGFPLTKCKPKPAAF